MEDELLSLNLTKAKYEQTLLGRVGGPEGPEIIVTCWKLGENEQEANFAMDIESSRQLLYDMLRAMKHMDPIAEKLFKAFKKVFEEASK
jgi:hypothetical protein